MKRMTFGLATPPLFDRLRGAQRVLLAGAGGGFDVYAGLPLFFALRAQGKDVLLANLTFTYLGGTDARLIAPHVAEVNVDAIVLVDGGTDILMRGDEAGLGTPEEDMTSVAAVATLDVAEKLVVCIGFGVDAHHGVCHAHFLENVAALTREGAYLGALSVLPTMPEGRAFLDAVAFAAERTPSRQSIVNGSVAAAVEGAFGDVRLSERTANSELFINPLMSLYFAFDLVAVARRCLYLPMLEGTQTVFEVAARIEGFRRGVATRPRRPIPH